MSNEHFTPGKLVADGVLVPELHYGPFLRDWWYFDNSKSEDFSSPIPIRLGFQVAIKLNNKHFNVRIVRNINNSNMPGFICEGEGTNSGVLSNSSQAINTIYRKVFGQNKTKYPGTTMLGFHDSYTIQQILKDVDFRPFIIHLDNIKIYIVSISNKNNDEGFSSCFTYKYKQKQSIIWQKIENQLFFISIFRDGQIVKQFQDTTASLVWNQTQLLQNYNGTDLFGINHSTVQQKIKERYGKLLPSKCTRDNWNDEVIMQNMFKLHLKKHVSGNEEIWYRVFNRWNNQKCTIIEIKSFIEEIYNNDHKLGTRELRAWRAIFEAVGCNNITPFEKDISDVSPKTIHSARKHYQKNGPGCKSIEKPIIIRKKMAEIKEREFELFFADKENVNMSSYHIDKKTQLPILYLKDQKSALWEKFSMKHPDGMKRTSFMARLQNGQFKYRDDLGGLCLICNDYAYQPFEDLIELVSNNVTDKKIKNNIITQLEMLRRHLKRDYENELFVYDNGTTNHVDCINHCLLYAFDHSYNTLLLEYQEKLICYLAHQTRKKYLGAQFNAVLNELDENGAIIIVDYKMRILPATARETKSEFFGKRGWTLHTTLVFQKKDNEKMKIQAHDHWSCDTKQDAWFTASCFEAVFNTINPRPHWIKIISDNGGHYHNSELMAIISHWYDWYGIEVRGWIFLEPGEAKTTVDSHHATIAHAIKRYVRIGCELTSGKDIEKAIEKLSGTSVAQIEPNRDKNNDDNNIEEQCNSNKKTKTIPGISKWFAWDWPINGNFEGYIRARSLPNIGNWKEFSPAEINTFCGKTNRPNPEFTTPTQSKIPWLSSLPMKKDSIQSNEMYNLLQNKNTQDQMAIDTVFPLKLGWALKENQKMGNKGGGKRISKKVVQYLQAYFHAGNLNPKDRYTAEKMYESLKELVKENELSINEIPEVKTIKGWIGRYNAASRKEMSEKALEENIIVDSSTNNNIQNEPNKARKRQKRKLELEVETGGKNFPSTNRAFYSQESKNNEYDLEKFKKGDMCKDIFLISDANAENNTNKIVKKLDR
ncbi:hypothetical protein Glove_198g95 [Diversispora epigaea]|uniref:Uncharacterized protein n=1 Tax=Diversispora epigaea TaxID=1348612 RepID=A0A397IQ39_9GLOM|nr:hypothetical protein Glove_198g95 [Diversispora epigaea]